MLGYPMKTKRKMSGFFIVEILIVLVIIGILVAALLPNLTTYTQRAKYLDNITAASALKSSVEMCILNLGTATGCTTGTNGIPTVTYGTTNVNTVAAANGVITATSQAIFGSGANTAYTYILTPTYANGNVTWAATGTCVAQGLC